MSDHKQMPYIDHEHLFIHLLSLIIGDMSAMLKKTRLTSCTLFKISHGSTCKVGHLKVRLWAVRESLAGCCSRCYQWQI